MPVRKIPSKKKPHGEGGYHEVKNRPKGEIERDDVLQEQRSAKRSSGYSYRKGEDGSRILFLPILKKSPFSPCVATIVVQSDKTVVATLDPSIASLPARQFASLDEAATILLDLYFNAQPAIITWFWQNHPDRFWHFVPKKWSYRSAQFARQGKLLPPLTITYQTAATIFPRH